MKDSLGNVIYVGKAKKLKSRVVQYFRDNGKHVPKIEDMISHIHTFETIGTDTELEAFLLECRLIKEIKPRYNRQMKNHEKYCYLQITAKEDFPRVSVVTERSDEDSTYFGPFISENCVENAIAFIQEQFPIRRCGGSLLVKRSSGCLNHQLGRCLGPCTGAVRPEEYQAGVSRIVALLEGREDTAVKDMQRKMAAAAEKLEFERAALYRDQIRGIRHVLFREKLIRESRIEKNVVAMEFFTEECLKLFLIKGNKMLYSERLMIGEQEGRNTMEQHLEKLLVEVFQVQDMPGKRRLDKEEIDEAQIIDSYLRRKHNIFYRRIPAAYLGKDRRKLQGCIHDMVDMAMEGGRLDNT